MMIRSLSRPHDEQLAVLEKTQIAGAQERPFAGVGQVGVEGALRFLGPIPIALGHAGPGDPNLADLVVGGLGQRVADRRSTSRWSSKLPPQPTISRAPASSATASTHLVVFQRLRRRTSGPPAAPT